MSRPESTGATLELTRQLVAIQSHSDAPGREAAIAEFLVRWLVQRGIEARLQPVVGKRANVIARVPGSGGPGLLLNGHLDTVPGGAMHDPFSPRLDAGLLWGRGTCDMKGAVAAMCVALSRLARRDVPLSGDVVFAGTVDEETGSLGVKALVESGVPCAAAIIGEPTGLRVAIAHKGSIFVRITLVGRAAHGSVPEEGVNAATHAAAVATAIETQLAPRLATRTHPLLGRSTVSIGRLCGGTQPNIVAARCEIDVDRRVLPGETGTIDELRDVVAAHCHGVPGLSYELSELPMTAAVPHVPLATDPEAPVARAALDACSALGLPSDPVGVTYWTDGGHLAASGIPTVVMGPGDIRNAHGPDERVPVEELHQASELYLLVAESLLARSAN